MKNYILLLVFSFLFAKASHAKDGYEIKIKLDNYTEKQAVLGFHLGDKQYIKDTATIDKDGFFVFKNDKEELPGGIYLLILLPKKEYFQVLVTKGEQYFSMQTNAKDPVPFMKVKGSKDNELFYSYLNYLNDQKTIGEKLKAEAKRDSADATKRKAIEAKIDDLDKEVKKYQFNVVEKNKNTLSAAIIKGSWDIDVPKFEGDEKEVQRKRYFYYKRHFFDNIDLGDARMLRTPLLFNRTDYYLNKLTVQSPDSINEGITRIIELTRPAEESFKFYVTHLLNFYAKSNIVGFDACYVYTALKYYKSGDAKWVDKEQNDKIVKNAEELEPILIGKIAPDLLMQKKDGTKISLYDIKTPYTIMFFWAPDCGHCQKSMPAVMEFYEKFKNRGVEIFAVCNKVTDKVPECWKFIEEKEHMSWINVVDPFLQSNYITRYDVKSTPQVFILDKNHKIISKRIGAEQLGEVMDEIMKVDAELLKQEMEKMKK